MKKVFITGCNGFIGQALVNRFIDEGYEVHGLYMEDQSKQKNKQVVYHQANLLDFDKVGEILEEVNPHFIIHLAAMTEVEKSFYDPIEFSTVNYSGTVNMIEKSKNLSNLELFVFSSTMETYGAVPKDLWTVFDEKTPQYPNAPYAVAKIGCEYYLEYAKRAYNFPCVILRQTNTYGRHDNDFFVVEQIITQMLKNKKEVNLGYREPYRNFLHISDLVELYSKILKNVHLAKGETFCTGPNNAVQIEKLAGIIADLIGWKGKINWGTKPERVGEIYFLNSTNAKASKILGWEPQINLIKGLAMTIDLWSEKLNIPYNNSYENINSSRSETKLCKTYS